MSTPWRARWLSERLVGFTRRRGYEASELPDFAGSKLRGSPRPARLLPGDGEQDKAIVEHDQARSDRGLRGRLRASSAEVVEGFAIRPEDGCGAGGSGPLIAHHGSCGWQGMTSRGLRRHPQREERHEDQRTRMCSRSAAIAAQIQNAPPSASPAQRTFVLLAESPQQRAAVTSGFGWRWVACTRGIDISAACGGPRSAPPPAP